MLCSVLSKEYVTASLFSLHNLSVNPDLILIPAFLGANERSTLCGMVE